MSVRPTNMHSMMIDTRERYSDYPMCLLGTPLQRLLPCNDTCGRSRGNAMYARSPDRIYRDYTIMHYCFLIINTQRSTSHDEPFVVAVLQLVSSMHGSWMHERAYMIAADTSAGVPCVSNDEPLQLLPPARRFSPSV